MAVNLLTSLNSNSDIDPASLARQLTDAEQTPQEELLNRKIEASDLNISAYGMVATALQSFKDSVEVLTDDDYLRALTAESTDPSVVPFITGTPSTGSYSLEITEIAKPSVMVSDSFASTGGLLNGGIGFDLNLLINGSPVSISVENDSYNGINDAINASGLPVSSRIVQTDSAGGAFVLVVEGLPGADSAVVFDDTDPAGVINLTETQPAQDAEIIFNGVTVTRSSNVVTDLIDGVSLALDDQSSGQFRLNINDDVDIVSSAVSDYVDAYNTMIDVYNALDGEPDEADELLGSLASDSSFRRLRSSLTDLLFSASDSGQSDMTYLSDIGVRITKTGKLELDSTALDEALFERPGEVVQLMTGRADDGEIVGEGLANLINDKLDSVLADDGPIRSREAVAERTKADYEDKLADLQVRMERVYQRYLSQFTTMNSIVSQINSTKESLITQLENLPFTRQTK